MPKILVVDDAPSVRLLLTNMLKADGMQVMTAASGAEGLELMVRDRPDAILLDVVMPLMDGLETLKRISEDARLARIPVMMITSVNDATRVKDALTLGARDYCIKPFDPHNLRLRVRRLLDTRERTAAPNEADQGARRIAGPDIRLSKKVLVVDDQPMIVNIAGEILEERYEVCTASSGAGALAEAAKERPDLILMDIYMPIMDGVEALRRIRQIPELKSVPVVALTLGSPEEQRLVAEFDGAVRKPLERNQVLDILGQLLGLPGLYGFSIKENILILRLYRFTRWDSVDVEDLLNQAERGFAKMLEMGESGFIVDLERLLTVPEPQLGQVSQVITPVIRRAKECHLSVKVVVPYRIRQHFERLGPSSGVEVFRRFPDALKVVQNARARSPELRHRSGW